MTDRRVWPVWWWCVKQPVIEEDITTDRIRLIEDVKEAPGQEGAV